MSRKCLACVIGAALVLGAPLTAVRADFETQLLKKFKSDNQSTAAKLSGELDGLLAQAATYQTSEPARALQLLLKCLPLLQDEQVLPKEERARYLRNLEDGLKLARAALADAQKASASQKHAAPTEDFASAAWPKSPYGAPGPPAPLQNKTAVSPPIFAAVPISAAVQTNAVVMPDRRWVRIGVSGSFSFARPGAIIPLQIPVPQVLQGPGKNVTVLPPIGVTQKITPVVIPAFTNVGINTTVMAPTGGSAVIGGFSTFSQGRTEFGAPVLGKIPYLSPFYRSVATGSQMNALSISVSPRIIIMEEEEQRFLGQLPPLPGR